ncbi:hypothetical protein KW818_06800 [Enterobacter quasiroggenkampii]|uniref:hypothetical protein n=1 Tax=Enterobacter quasiroggenkampii TaxID=2497436 RepID=UPI0021D23324|nr:hypothetical protein [Enterobacter quasiroggenkampii]MCU6388830.1 hypothetical protein [Enterobacter quasiroggenkampii]
MNRSDPQLPGGHTLPDAVSDLTDYPLYLAVAIWGLRTATILSTAVVSREFHITQQRARDALHYIRHEARSRVSAEDVPLAIPGLNRVSLYKGLRVSAVSAYEPPAAPHPSRKADSRARPCTRQKLTPAQRLRQWMVSRRPGLPVPDALLTGGE